MAPSERTPAWGGPEAAKDEAGPRTWRGVGPALDDWGELNTNKQAPAVFVWDQRRAEVLQVRRKTKMERQGCDGDFRRGNTTVMRVARSAPAALAPRENSSGEKEDLTEFSECPV